MSAQDPPWWRDAIVHEIYVRSFADSDGDGIGDLPGITQRLPYLVDLGVDAIWLTPFYVSPMADHGYDVADPRAVDPLFGTMEDFDALLARAHALGLRVVVDVVPNHTSDRHQWFRQACAAPAGSAERARYLFREGRGEGPPNDWESVFGGPAWSRLPDGQWYLHLFAPEQPDLNWRNPQVRAEYESVLRFWLDRGVDGFRIDVAHGLLKDPDLPDAGPDQRPDRLADRRALPQWDRDKVHEIYRDWRRIAAEYPNDRVLLGEAWVTPAERLARYVRPDELHQVFNFEYLQAPWDAGALRTSIAECLSSLDAVGASPTWTLSNHDVVRHRTRLGRPEPDHRARCALLLMLALPGSAYLFQGEELGLEQVDLPDEVLADPVWERSGHTDRGRDGARVPIPWSGDRSPFGFSRAEPWLPMPQTFAGRTAAAEQGDPDSMWSFYAAALRIRRSCPAFRSLELQFLDTAQDVVAFRRTGSDGTVLHCAVNTGREPARLGLPGSVRLGAGAVDTEDGLRLGPDSAAWLF